MRLQKLAVQVDLRVVEDTLEVQLEHRAAQGLSEVCREGEVLPVPAPGNQYVMNRPNIRGKLKDLDDILIQQE